MGAICMRATRQVHWDDTGAWGASTQPTFGIGDEASGAE
jgi:hypothetical protein